LVYVDAAGAVVLGGEVQGGVFTKAGVKLNQGTQDLRFGELAAAGYDVLWIDEISTGYEIYIEDQQEGSILRLSFALDGELTYLDTAFIYDNNAGDYVDASSDSFSIQLDAKYWSRNQSMPAVATVVEMGSKGNSSDLDLFFDPFNPTSALSDEDVIAALKIGLGVNPNVKGEPVRLAQFAAADTDGNGVVNSLDALNILKLTLSGTSNPTPGWLWFEKTLALSEVDSATYNWEQDLIVDLAKIETIEIIGALRGDVDGSWALPKG